MPAAPSTQSLAHKAESRMVGQGVVAGRSPVRAYDERVTAHWLLIPARKYESISNRQVILQVRRLTADLGRYTRAALLGKAMQNP